MGTFFCGVCNFICLGDPTAKLQALHRRQAIRESAFASVPFIFAIAKINATDALKASSLLSLSRWLIFLLLICIQLLVWYFLKRKTSV